MTHMPQTREELAKLWHGNPHHLRYLPRHQDPDDPYEFPPELAKLVGDDPVPEEMEEDDA